MIFRSLFNGEILMIAIINGLLHFSGFDFILTVKDFFIFYINLESLVTGKSYRHTGL